MVVLGFFAMHLFVLYELDVAVQWGVKTATRSWNERGNDSVPQRETAFRSWEWTILGLF